MKREASEDDRERQVPRTELHSGKQVPEKKKQFVSELEEKKTTLECKHAQLQVESQRVVEGGVGSLKN